MGLSSSATDSAIHSQLSNAASETDGIEDEMSRNQIFSKNLRKLLLASATGAALLATRSGLHAIEPASVQRPGNVTQVTHESFKDRLAGIFDKSKSKISQTFRPQSSQTAESSAPKRSFYSKVINKLKGEPRFPSGPPQDPGMHYPTASSKNQLQAATPPAGPPRQSVSAPPKPLAELPQTPPHVSLPEPVVVHEQPRAFPDDHQADAAQSALPPKPKMFDERPTTNSSKSQMAAVQKNDSANSDQLPVIIPKGNLAPRPVQTAERSVSSEQIRAFENALEVESKQPQFLPPVQRSNDGRPVIDLEEIVAEVQKHEADMSVSVVEPQSETPEIAPMPAMDDIPATDTSLADFFPEDAPATIPPMPESFPDNLSLEMEPVAEPVQGQETVADVAPLTPQTSETVEEPHTGLALEQDLFENLPLPPVDEAKDAPVEKITSQTGFVQLEPTAVVDEEVDAPLPPMPEVELPVVNSQEPPQLSASETDIAKAEKIAARAASGLKGFCPVALRDQRQLIDGDERFSAYFANREYKFSSAQALEKFLATPEKYAPAQDGRDVIHYALTGENVEGLLDYAVWYKGQLYLFTSVETMETFMAAPIKHVSQ